MSTGPRFGIDGHGLAHQRTGVGHYVASLIEAMASLLPPEELAVYLQRQLPDAIPFRTVIVPPSPLWTTLRLSLHFARRGGPEVMLYPAHAMPLYSAPRAVVTITDLACELFPAHFTRADRARLRMITRHSVRRADLLIAISESTARDLVDLYRVDAARVRTIPLAVRGGMRAPDPARVAAVRARFGLERPYVLSVGTLQMRKNHATLIRALPLLHARGVDVDLVFAGGPGWLFDDTRRQIRDLGLEDRVRLTGYVPDADLPALYAGAEAFALISLYEGFGLPVLEAIACGVPTLVADNSSLPEVGGDAALRVEALDTEAVADSLVRLVCDRELRGALRAAAPAHLARFSWERTARMTLDVLREAA